MKAEAEQNEMAVATGQNGSNKPKCQHPLCTGKHSSKWRIAELCPNAQEKRRASWRAYDRHLHEAHVRSYAARLGDPDVKLDMRGSHRSFYKYMWAVRKRVAEKGARLQFMQALATKGGAR